MVSAFAEEGFGEIAHPFTQEGVWIILLRDIQIDNKITKIIISIYLKTGRSENAPS